MDFYTLANRGETVGNDLMAGDFVVKIEPKENGPLFCETHFYSNCAKKDDRKFLQILIKVLNLLIRKRRILNLGIRSGT